MARKYDGCGNDGNEMKLRWDLIPFEALEQVVKVYTFGAKKYGDNQWQGVEPSRYLGALLRHISAYCQEQVFDDESGLLTIAHAAWNALALVYFAVQELDEQAIREYAMGSQAVPKGVRRCYDEAVVHTAEELKRTGVSLGTIESARSSAREHMGKENIAAHDFWEIVAMYEKAYREDAGE